MLFLVLPMSVSFLVLSYVGIAVQLRNIYRVWDAKAWVSTPGLTETWNLEYDEADKVYTPFLSYTYLVDGQRYRGFAVSLGHEYQSYPEDFTALKQLEAYPIGQPVTVYHDRDKPSDAVLQTNAGEGLLYPLCIIFLACPFGLLFGLGGLANVFISEKQVAICAVLCLFGGAYFLPSYDGNAEKLKGGAEAQREFQTAQQSEREFWESLKAGDSETVFKGLRAKRTPQETSSGPVVVLSWKRGSSYERPARVVLRQSVKGGPYIVDKVEQTPFFPIDSSKARI